MAFYRVFRAEMLSLLKKNKKSIMENLINRLVIRNFKSIQHIDLPCKRVNVFIGAPNVGKSNILEAIGLLGFGYSQNEEKYLSDLIRYESLGDLFFEKQKKRVISVETNLGSASFWKEQDEYHFFVTDSKTNSISFDKKYNKLPFLKREIEKYLKKNVETGNHTFDSDNWRGLGVYYETIETDGVTNLTFETSRYNSIVKKYEFVKNAPKNGEIDDFLRPPHGHNLFSIIANNKEIWKEAKDRFEKYKLNLVYKQHENTFEIQKNVDGFVTDYPYENMADTLQRIIFYLAAIESNKNSVLVFEELEAHAFPPYTAELADRIALDDENQYFLTTHSPYLLNTLLSALGEDELNLVLVYYEDYETKVKALSQEEIKEAISDNFNLFFNLDKFLYAKEELHD
ncbi:MAG: ATPase [Bacteroidetes bacterium]|nr:MAG: ATPase [Bacteroidota bacterium]